MPRFLKAYILRYWATISWPPEYFKHLKNDLEEDKQNNEIELYKILTVTQSD